MCSIEYHRLGQCLLYGNYEERRQCTSQRVLNWQDCMIGDGDSEPLEVIKKKLDNDRICFMPIDKLT